MKYEYHIVLSIDTLTIIDTQWYCS